VKRILINTPDFSLQGGVSMYYSTIKTYLPDNIDYFHYGKNIEIKNSVIKSLLKLFNDFKKFTKLLNTGKYELIVLNPSLGFSALIRDGIFCWLAKKKKLIVVIYWRGWNVEKEKYILRFPYSLYYRFSIKIADAMIVLNSIVKNTLIKSGYTRKIFYGTTVADDYLFEKQNLMKDNNYFNILFLARVERYKGVYELIEAYKYLKKKYAQLTLTIAGDGKELENIKKIIHDEDINDINIAGFVDGNEKRIVFNKASCYVFPSYSEGMPNSVIEAMACELPVVTTKVGGIIDFFVENKMGLFIDKRSVSSIIEKVSLIFDNPEMCITFGKINYEYASKHFKASVVARNYNVLLNSIIREKIISG